MGVDSGLPDFRGDEGFWKAYPPFKSLGLSFSDLADPIWFQRDPHQAWGFYGHRLQLYRSTTPHAGFMQLQEIAERFALELFVFTSNVDGQFQKSGFDSDRVVECHGSIQHLQCTEPCSHDIWVADEMQIEIDEATFRAHDPLPKCKRCGAVARPNILMFGDANWLPGRTSRQEHRYSMWQLELEGGLVALEFGAGTAIPSVRYELERQTAGRSDQLIRVNPRESQTRDGISVPLGAAEAIEGIYERLGGL